MVRDVRSAAHSVAEVEAAIDACFDDVARTVGTFQGFDRVWESMRQASTGGKLLRPRLLLSAQRAFGGAPDEHALQAAVAMELLHGVPAARRRARPRPRAAGRTEPHLAAA
ncbi:hypothetical protein JCM13591A_40010 [Microbacterium xylanilyticum]